MLQNLKCRTVEHSRRQGDFIDIAKQCNNMTTDERSSGSTLVDSDYSSSSTGQKYNQSIECFFLFSILFWELFLFKYKLIHLNEYLLNKNYYSNFTNFDTYPRCFVDTAILSLISLIKGLKMVSRRQNTLIPIYGKK